ncbi:hypothetical protein CFK37_14070 [Virgibacillus phasianinus]|uniref:Uncharacterized protein n=1 Tax=Virgibacillus phasianinus TaxID=2017483 RepID=A0A220U5E7_9BACI|nr:hypothetical protein [Virgibacillus phasianinus]ASK63192.1 hypothetical protein CFK37_14070 [Virgibacillus phasianinus]
MRIILLFGVVLSAMVALYKWRYKLMNMILAVSVLRKLGVMITMNMPAIKNKILSNMFTKTSTNG